MARRALRAVAALGLVTAVLSCASAPPPPADAPVWPPRGLESPGEVVWQREVGRLRPRGYGRFLRALAGEPRRSSPWDLGRPVAVAASGGRLAVADPGTGTAFLCDLDGGRAVRLELPEEAVPVGVAASPAGDMWYVADGPGGRVLRFDGDGEKRGEITPTGGVGRLGGVAVARNGDLLLTDVARSEVLRMTHDGTVVHRVGGAGSGPGQLNHPTALAEAADGTVWVLDTLNFRAQHLDAEMGYIGHFGQHGDGSGHFALPKGLTIDHDGHLYVSDAQFDLVQVFDPDGRLLLVIGGRGDGPGEFWSPAGLATDGRGTIVVADSGNRRVQVLEYRRRGDER